MADDLVSDRGSIQKHINIPTGIKSLLVRLDVDCKQRSNLSGFFMENQWSFILVDKLVCLKSKLYGFDVVGDLLSGLMKDGMYGAGFVVGSLAGVVIRHRLRVLRMMLVLTKRLGRCRMWLREDRGRQILGGKVRQALLENKFHNVEIRWWLEGKKRKNWFLTAGGWKSAENPEFEEERVKGGKSRSEVRWEVG